MMVEFQVWTPCHYATCKICLVCSWNILLKYFRPGNEIERNSGASYSGWNTEWWLLSSICMGLTLVSSPFICNSQMNLTWSGVSSSKVLMVEMLEISVHRIFWRKIHEPFFFPLYHFEAKFFWQHVTHKKQF